MFAGFPFTVARLSAQSSFQRLEVYSWLHSPQNELHLLFVDDLYKVCGNLLASASYTATRTDPIGIRPISSIGRRGSTHS